MSKLFFFEAVFRHFVIYPKFDTVSPSESQRTWEGWSIEKPELQPIFAELWPIKDSAAALRGSWPSSQHQKLGRGPCLNLPCPYCQTTRKKAKCFWLFIKIIHCVWRVVPLGLKALVLIGLRTKLIGAKNFNRALILFGRELSDPRATNVSSAKYIEMRNWKHIEI